MPSHRVLGSALVLSLLLSSLVSATAHAEDSPSASPPVAPSPTPAPPPPSSLAPQVAQGTAVPGAAPLATQPLPPSSAHERAPSSWYGWQTLIADGATLGSSIAFAAASTGSQAGTLVTMNGLAGYALAAPSIHLLHHRPLIALLDLAIRAGAPTLGGFIGAGASNCHQSPELDENQTYACGLWGGLVGITLGAVVASAIDAAVLARTPAEEPEPEPGPKLARTFSIAPDLIVTKDQGAIGLRGTF